MNQSALCDICNVPYHNETQHFNGKKHKANLALMGKQNRGIYVRPIRGLIDGTKENISAFFSQFGPVNHVIIPPNKFYAIVDFTEEAPAITLKNMKSISYMGNWLKVFPRKIDSKPVSIFYLLHNKHV